MLSLETWAYEIMTLESGYLNVDDQAAQVVLINLLSILFMFSIGMQQATSSLIGQEIGRNNVRKAKQILNVVYSLSLGMVVADLVLFYLLRHCIFALFTTNREVVDKCEEVFLIVILGAFPD